MGGLYWVTGCGKQNHQNTVIPADAGTHRTINACADAWAPARAWITMLLDDSIYPVPLALDQATVLFRPEVKCRS
jgi:hypothetical protein